MLAYLQRGGQMVLNFLRPKKKMGWVSFVFLTVLALGAVLITTPATHAMWDTVAEVLSSFCLMIATLFLKLTIFVLTFIIQIAAYNGYLDSTAVNYGWVMVRDITNMGFVVILLLIAFGTILGLEQYEWKKMMVKFVLAAILVNFSRVICGVMIDVAQVIMVTFINGVAATAGGNLIQMFNMDKIMSLTADSKSVNTSEVLMASVAAVFFAAMMLGVMAVFLIILAARMLTLWVLIVLSPLAFVLSVIPQTQKYASEWWQNFGSNVVSGPVVAFFLWLSFVTVGGGNINSEIAGHSQIAPESKISATSEADKIGNAQQTAGLSSAMSWDKMANFVIAIGMLLVGARTAQQLGVTGGSMMSKATDFAKKAATIATGVAAGKWAYDKMGGAKGIGKAVGMNIPLVGGKAMVRYGKGIRGVVGGKLADLGDWRNRKANKIGAESTKYRKSKMDLDEKLKNKGRLERLDAAYNADPSKFEGGEEAYKKQREELEKSAISQEDYNTQMDELKNKRPGLISRGWSAAGEKFWETGGRADKRAENWDDYLEARKKSSEANYSTSGSASGLLKLSARVDLEFNEQMAKAKAIQKTADLAALRMSGAQGLVEQYSDAEKLKAAGLVPTAAYNMALAQGKSEVAAFRRSIAEAGLQGVAIDKGKFNKKTGKMEDDYGSLKNAAAAAALNLSTLKTQQELAALRVSDDLIKSKVSNAGMSTLLQNEMDRRVGDERSERARKSAETIENLPESQQVAKARQELEDAKKDFKDSAGELAALTENIEKEKRVRDAAAQAFKEKDITSARKAELNEIIAKSQKKINESLLERDKKTAIAQSRERTVSEKTSEFNTAVDSRRAAIEKFGKVGPGFNAQIANMFSEVIKEEGEIFGANVGQLKEDVMQKVVGDPRGITYPNTTYISMAQKMLGNYAGMDKQQMLSTFEAAANRLMSKAGTPGYEGSKDAEVDRAYFDVISFKLNKECFKDDAQGKAEGKVFATEFEQVLKRFNQGVLANYGKSLEKKFGEIEKADANISRKSEGSSLWKVVIDPGHSDRDSLSKVLEEVVKQTGSKDRGDLLSKMYDATQRKSVEESLVKARSSSSHLAAWEKFDEKKLFQLLHDVSSKTDPLERQKFIDFK